MLTLKLSCTPDCDDCFTCGPGTHEEDGVCIPDEEADADTDTDVECGVVAFRRAYGDIWTMDEDGSKQTQVTASDDQKNYPSISPDCSQIAYSNYTALTLNVVDIDGGNDTIILDSGVHWFRPAWSPDGTSLASSSELDGERAIYTMNIDGTGLSRVTDAASFAGDPWYSPDGISRRS